MRHPHRSRTVALVVFLAGAAALIAAVLMPDAGRGVTLQGVFGIGGLMAVVFGGVAAVVWHRDARAQDRLLRGDGVIARWHIEPDRWEAFIALNQRLDRERGADLLNALAIRRPTAGRAVEVVVSETAVQVDGDFHPLPAGTYPVRGVERLPGPPPCLEFALLWPAGPGDSDSRMSLRFPIAAGSGGEELAALVMARYRSARDGTVHRRLIPVRDPRRVIAALLAVAAVCGAAFLTGMSLRGREDLGLLPPLAALCGAMIGLGALLFALVVYVRRGDP